MTSKQDDAPEAGELERLRAEVATVTAERDTFRAEFAKLTTDRDTQTALLTVREDKIERLYAELDAEREVHAELRKAHDRVIGAHIEERERADALAELVRENQMYIHYKENHSGVTKDCQEATCIDEIAALAAHAARRTEKGRR